MGGGTAIGGGPWMGCGPRIVGGPIRGKDIGGGMLAGFVVGM